MTLDDWQSYYRRHRQPGRYATVLAVTGTPDWAAVDDRQPAPSPKRRSGR